MNHDTQSAQFPQKQDGRMLHSDKKKTNQKTQSFLDEFSYSFNTKYIHYIYII